MSTYAKAAARNFESQVSSKLSSKLNQSRINRAQSQFNFQNYSSNHNALTATFGNHTFSVLKEGDKKLRHTDGEKAREKKIKRDNKNATTLTPLFVQIEAVLYLGCNQISQKAYTRP